MNKSQNSYKKARTYWIVLQLKKQKDGLSQEMSESCVSETYYVVSPFLLIFD